MEDGMSTRIKLRYLKLLVTEKKRMSYDQKENGRGLQQAGLP